MSSSRLPVRPTAAQCEAIIAAENEKRTADNKYDVITQMKLASELLTIKMKMYNDECASLQSSTSEPSSSTLPPLSSTTSSVTFTGGIHGGVHITPIQQLTHNVIKTYPVSVLDPDPPRVKGSKKGSFHVNPNRKELMNYVKKHYTAPMARHNLSPMNCVDHPMYQQAVAWVRNTVEGMGKELEDENIDNKVKEDLLQKVETLVKDCVKYSRRSYLDSHKDDKNVLLKKKQPKGRKYKGSKYVDSSKEEEVHEEKKPEDELDDEEDEDLSRTSNNQNGVNNNNDDNDNKSSSSSSKVSGKRRSLSTDSKSYKVNKKRAKN